MVKDLLLYSNPDVEVLIPGESLVLNIVESAKK